MLLTRQRIIQTDGASPKVMRFGGFKRDFRFRREKHIYEKSNSTKTSNHDSNQSLAPPLPLPALFLLIPLVLAWCALSPNAAAQSRVITEKPKKPIIKLIVPDLWCPSGIACKFYNIPNYDPRLAFSPWRWATKEVPPPRVVLCGSVNLAQRRAPAPSRPTRTTGKPFQP